MILKTAPKVGPTEKKLMSLSAQFFPDSEPKGIDTLLKGSPIHWDKFIAFLSWHGVFPLVFERLSHHKDLIDEGVFQKMHMMYLSLTMVNLKKYSIVKDMAQTLQRDKVGVCFVKGALLSLQIYGRPAFRNFYDIDILTREDNYLGVINMLMGKGFMNMGNPRPSDNYIWQACQQEKYDDVLFWSLAPEDTLAYLIMHGSQHRFSRFHFVLDILGFYVAFSEKFCFNRFRDTVDYCGMETLVRNAEGIISSFYPSFQYFFTPQKQTKSVGAKEWLVDKVILNKDRIKNLESKPFFKRFESPLLYFFFMSGFLDKILYLKNILFFQAIAVKRAMISYR